MATGQYQIPFDAEGNQQHYPSITWGPTDPETGRPTRIEPTWRDNVVFDDTLTYNSFGRGRSAAYFEFRRQDGTTVTVFMKEFDEMIPHMNAGVVKGRFRFIKRGMNYGCKLLGTSL